MNTNITLTRSYGPLGEMHATYVPANGEVTVRWYEGPESRSTGYTLVETTWIAPEMSETAARHALGLILDELDEDPADDPNFPAHWR